MHSSLLEIQQGLGKKRSQSKRHADLQCQMADAVHEELGLKQQNDENLALK